ncbi:MAG: flippase-like domain-containing protein [Pyrinomonadaceae bacterium]|nr:flippase-like domain-containing protein [Pyrinomonadaceae bacterium]
MNHESKIETPVIETQNPAKTKNLQRLKIFGGLLTTLGIGLFAYFVYSVGINLIWDGVGRIGFGGFAFLMVLYFLRIVCRAYAWTISVHEPYKLSFRDTLPAVIIGEALSSLIPLGVLVSGTSKAVAVRHRVPLVVGLSSIATENLFYSLVTGLFIVFGAFAFLRSFELETTWILTIDVLIGVIFALITFAVLMVVRQWHLISLLCEWLYNRNIGKSVLENGRLHARLFENLIYDFYRQYPRRFLPICFFQVVFHVLGILEVWFVLSRISAVAPDFFCSFLLESMSRVITIVFKLVPFLIGVDEAGAQFVAQTLALGAGVGVTLAIVRKGRILFWTAIGLLLIAKRGLSLKEITKNLK